MPTIPWRALGRTLLQLLLTAPLLALLPWALLMGVGTLVFLFTGEARELSKTVFYGFGWLGLLGGPMAVAAWNLWRLHGPLSAAMPAKHLPGPEAP